MPLIIQVPPGNVFQQMQSIIDPHHENNQIILFSSNCYCPDLSFYHFSYQLTCTPQEQYGLCPKRDDIVLRNVIKKMLTLPRGHHNESIYFSCNFSVSDGMHLRDHPDLLKCESNLQQSLNVFKYLCSGQNSPLVCVPLMNRFLKQLGPFSLLISLEEQSINCANKFLCTWVCVHLCRHQAALRTALRTTQVICSIERKCCHSESPFLLKAVTDKINSYLRAKQDILEVCNCNEREGIPSLHSRGAACVCAMLHTQKQRVRFRFFVSPLHSALGAGWNHKLPVPLRRRVLFCWWLQPKVMFQDLMWMCGSTQWVGVGQGARQLLVCV